MPNKISGVFMPQIILQISKVVNEIYHQYNGHQYPFVALHITMKKGWQLIKALFRLMKTTEPRVAN